MSDLAPQFPLASGAVSSAPDKSGSSRIGGLFAPCGQDRLLPSVETFPLAT